MVIMLMTELGEDVFVGEEEEEYEEEWISVEELVDEVDEFVEDVVWLTTELASEAFTLVATAFFAAA